MKFDIYCDESRPDLFTAKSAPGDKYLLHARGHQEEPKVDWTIKEKSRWFAKRAQRLKPL